MRKLSGFAKTINVCCFASGILTAVFFTVYHFSRADIAQSIAITLLTFFYHFAMRLIVGFAVPKFVSGVNPETRSLAAGKKELALYRKLNLKKHKDKIPTYAPELFDAKLHSVREIAVEMCKAEIVHLVIIPLCFVPTLLIPIWGAAGVFIATSVIAALADSVFVVLQRYNLARIQPLLKRKELREIRQ